MRPCQDCAREECICDAERCYRCGCTIDEADNGACDRCASVQLPDEPGKGDKDVNDRQAYNDLDAWNWSKIKYLRKRGGGSPLLFRHMLRQPDKDKDVYQFGRLVHSVVLNDHDEQFSGASDDVRSAVLRYRANLDTPERDLDEIDAMIRAAVDGVLSSKYAVYDGVRNKRAAKYQAWMEEHPGVVAVKARDLETAEQVARTIAQIGDATILRMPDYLRATCAAAAVCGHDAAASVLRDADTEVTLTWVDPTTGLRCKGRADAVRESDRHVIDVKTAGRPITLHQVESQIWQFGYHIQLAAYGRGVEATLGWRPERYTLIYVESNAPHDVAVVTLELSAIEQGLRELDQIMTSLAACADDPALATGKYPDPVRVDLPEYAYDGDVITFGRQ